MTSVAMPTAEVEARVERGALLSRWAGGNALPLLLLLLLGAWKPVCACPMCQALGGQAGCSVLQWK